MCNGDAPSAPKYKGVDYQPNQYDINENIPQGDQLLASLRTKMNQGIDPNTLLDWRNAGINSAAGNFNSGMNKISNLGNNISLKGRAEMINSLYANRGEDLTKMNNTISQADQQAKQQNFWNSASAIPGLSATAYQIGAGKFGQKLQNTGMENQFNMGNFQNQIAQYNSDRFNWEDILGGLLGLGGTLGGAAIAKSDRKFKKNIKFLTSRKGINIYNFDYIDGGNSNGVIAQEIINVLPSAVINREDGLYVDYNKVIEYLK